jgi:7-keto-8-aminopelargonate synthetase-like enzyme
MFLLNSAVGNFIKIDGKKYSYFAGNDYLGLANHPEIKKAAIKATKLYGVNFAASRRTTGTSVIHLELEKLLATFKNKQDAVVFASGYLGNSILLDVLRPKYSAVYVDQQAHSSIIGSIPGNIKNVYYYDHCDPNHLETLLEHNKETNPLIITDGVFALTGEIAPLDKIFALVKKFSGILVVDDAHSTGILGKTGRGTPEHFNLPYDENIYQTETMSKALGSYGGFISGSAGLVDLVREKSATYQASTALPPPIIGASLASLKIITENPGLRVQLIEKSNELRNEIATLGFHTNGDGTPIIPILFSDAGQAKKLSVFLEKKRIISPFINYPVKLGKSMIRITVSANHTSSQTEQFLEVLNQWKIKNGTD